jgi:hypothetical protein
MSLERAAQFRGWWTPKLRRDNALGTHHTSQCLVVFDSHGLIDLFLERGNLLNLLNEIRDTDDKCEWHFFGFVFEQVQVQSIDESNRFDSLD